MPKVCLILISCIVVGSCSQPTIWPMTQPAKEDRVYYLSYSFDESSGTTATDSSANGWNGILSGCARVPGKVGNAVELNVASAHVDIDSHFINLAANHFLDALSIDTWIEPYLVDPAKIYAVVAGFNYHELSMEIRSSKVVIVLDGTVYLTSNSSIAPNAWTHVAFTYDGTFLRLYINGIEDTSGKPKFATQNIYGVTYSIGSRKVSPGYTDDFVGKIDEFHVWKEALTPAAVLACYNSTK
jgi:hypothetical protein